ncbi:MULTISPECIES: biotin carboxylase N-terminal domain-containing protein [unclassified Streptomyces]|uniref:biotin carboxylase N-terminal domain-containing protein n=1 Tax=unclassified Streptomyces TaxID=2593676 RepID=UPI0022580B0E|nr:MULTISPECIES: biotin carboxylase N-terminal domain-containing protein [unclassified Streptomyces]MCX5146390.1 ATP-grasp domain-containing protein [Streptomyces sp. NBC_00320]WSN49587.1 biotin carboxylase N-terminal domain-containing protein [Streptomyces sp. NBC_01296]
MKRVLIANRGAIAARAVDTFRTLGWSPIAVVALSDPQRLHTLAADGCEYLEGAGLAETYDHVGRIVEAARRCGADAVYPGYGALAEDPELPRQLAAAGIAFIGPTAEVLEAARDKEHAVATADRLGLPVLPHATGHRQIAELVKEIGLPVILKPVTGCGGLGVRIVQTEAEAEQALALIAEDGGAGEVTGAHAGSADGEADGDGDGTDWYAERYVEQGRVVGVTVAVDDAGTVHPLGERESLLVDGSMKLLEASPVLGVAPELLERMRRDTARLVTGMGLRGVATVEFIVGARGHYFLEVNGRLPLAYRMCEAQTGLDVVAFQMELAQGAVPAPGRIRVDRDTHCLEARLFIDPAAGGAPGRITALELAPEPGVTYNCALDVRRPVVLDNIVTQVLACSDGRGAAAGAVLRAVGGSGVSGVAHCAEEIAVWLRGSGLVPERLGSQALGV